MIYDFYFLYIINTIIFIIVDVNIKIKQHQNHFQKSNFKIKILWRTIINIYVDINKYKNSVLEFTIINF